MTEQKDIRTLMDKMIEEEAQRLANDPKFREYHSKNRAERRKMDKEMRKDARKVQKKV